MNSTRAPDTYVKTVLTFYDKPVSAMAQIALRKTAKRTKESHPYAAAEVFKKKTYMDDICDSVPTFESAQNLRYRWLSSEWMVHQMKPWTRICKRQILRVSSFWEAGPAKKF